MKISVVIVSYNVKHYLAQCLYSLRKALEGIEAEVYVVDNHSHDGTIDYLKDRFPELKLIESQHNNGFACANNMALRRCRGEYVLLLNPDTVVAEHTIARSIAFMEAHPQAGGAGVKMLMANGKPARESRRGLPTPMTAFYKMCGLCAKYPHHRRFGKYYMGYLPWDEPARIEIVSGAYCLLRRSVLDEIGFLDEDFFMYGEDIDLSYRILKAGFENWYLPYPIL
ncbi:MAG TPA: glycosyltransferase family 2 protein, partial [Prevotella sp.]